MSCRCKRAARLGETVRDDVVEIVRDDGNVIQLTCHAAPLYDEAGKPRGAVGAFIDTTEQTRTQQALRESEQRYRSLVELAPDAIIVHSDGCFVYANAAALRLYGASNTARTAGSAGAGSHSPGRPGRGPGQDQIR